MSFTLTSFFIFIFAVLLHLLYKLSYSRFCLKCCCHGNRGRP